MSDEEHEGGPESSRRRREQARPKITLGAGVPPEVAEMLGGIFSPFSRGSITSDAPVGSYVKSLRSMASALAQPYDFVTGDIVRFKPGLNHTRLSSYMIVQSVADRKDAVRGADDPAYASYCDLQDVVCGVIVKNDQFFEFTVDGRRLEKVPDEELALDGA